MVPTDILPDRIHRCEFEAPKLALSEVLAFHTGIG
jgi:hypothetical protein